MKRIFLVLLLCLSLVACQSKTDVKKKKVGVIQLVSHASLDASYEGFKQALFDHGYDETKLDLDLHNAQGDQGNLTAIADSLIANQPDLILAIATKSAQALASKTKDIPILGTAITDYVAAELIESNEKPGGNISGTTDLNPIRKQLELLKKLVPEAKTIGLIYNSSEENSLVQIKLAKDILGEMGLEYVEQTVNSTNDVAQAMASLVLDADAIYIPTDNTLASSVSIVKDIAIEAKKAVIVGAADMVSDGALATYGISYYQLGYQTGEMAVKILKGEAQVGNLAIESQTNLELHINREVAAAIGLELPADLK